MNLVVLMGRLVRDVEVKYSQGSDNLAIASLTLAVDRKFKKDGEATADFINCKCFGKQAESLEKYCQKGTKIAVTGRWQSGSYKNKDGNTVYTNDCIIDSWEFAESKGSNESNETPKASKTDSDGFMNVVIDGDSDLPFV